MKKAFVTASELGEYVYCKRAWWKHHHGLTETSYSMVRGNQQHNKLSGNLRFNTLKVVIALILFIIGLFVILVYYISQILHG